MLTTSQTTAFNEAGNFTILESVINSSSDAAHMPIASRTNGRLNDLQVNDVTR
jgi:hypothetical protein